jgi:peptide/nickel transport system permease protein
MNIGFAKRVISLGRTRPMVIFAALVLLGIVFAAVFAGVIAPDDPLTQDTSHRLQSPGNGYLLGSDNFGRDVFSRTLHGARTALTIGLASVALGTAIGTVVGLASAYRGGWVDLLVQRVVDAFFGFPLMVLAVVIVATFGASANTVIAAIAVAIAPQVARLSRSSALSVRASAHIMAAHSIGAGSTRILFRHFLPHTLGPVLAYATGFVATALVAEAALSFLGLGVPPPNPSWGGMLSDGREFLEVAPWLTLVPAAALSVTALCFVLLGDFLRDVMDPTVTVQAAGEASVHLVKDS